MSAASGRNSILETVHFFVYSHLRWNFVYQRPQHLFSRCSRQHPVFFIEEPVFHEGIKPQLTRSYTDDGVTVVVPELPTGMTEEETFSQQEILLHQFWAELGRPDVVAWFYTPMAVNFTRKLKPAVTVYDCMDELSAFRDAPPGLTAAEGELFASADLVFTGGQSLFESKRSRHSSVHCFPSSIDTSHFVQARDRTRDADDQAHIPHPRLGYCGVIDERMDLELLEGAAQLRPDWQFVMVGPVVKISQADLPRRDNIHYLGSKSYRELPGYLAGWDIALLPFACNESTRFISPTKTPEYLAAGRPVISTPIRDVVRPYGDLGMVHVTDTAEGLVKAAERLLAQSSPEAESERLRRVDEFLAGSSWDRTWSEMHKLVVEVAAGRGAAGRTAAADLAERVASADL